MAAKCILGLVVSVKRSFNGLLGVTKCPTQLLGRTKDESWRGRGKEIKVTNVGGNSRTETSSQLFLRGSRFAVKSFLLPDQAGSGFPLRLKGDILGDQC